MNTRSVLPRTAAALAAGLLSLTLGWSESVSSAFPVSSSQGGAVSPALAQGGISVTATLTVTYNPPTGGPGDLSGMTIWAGKWFKVEITQRGEDKPGAVAYLKVQSWDTGARILHATLYSLNSSTTHWDSTDLSLRYTSGTPLKFMFSFDYEGILGFTGKVDGETRDGATLAKATFRATGLSQAKKHGEAEDDDNVISIKGDLTSNLPSGL